MNFIATSKIARYETKLKHLGSPCENGLKKRAKTLALPLAGRVSKHRLDDKPGRNESANACD